MLTPHSPNRSVWPRLVVAVVVPLVFFAALEGVLRVSGFGFDARFFIPDEQAGVYRTNLRFTERFFPASFGLKPVNLRLTKRKPANSVRVFVLGESAAMGVPEPAFGLAPHLRAHLRALSPGAEVEVHNLGVTAINSHVVLEIAREALAFSPDLFVIYMGNNEVVGPYGASSVVTTGTPPRRMIRAALRLRSTRTGQLLHRFSSALRPAGARREWGGMEMFAGRVVAGDDPALERVRDLFAANLDDLLARAGAAGVPVILSTVAVNVRDHAPFASLPVTAPETWTNALRSLALEDDAAARVQLEAVVAAHPTHADAHFRLARLLERAGEVTQARRHYLEAWRHDALRFRADEEINARIRSAAQKHRGHVDLVDAADALGASADGSPLAGFEAFFEHVHLTQAGNARLARLLSGPAARRLWRIDPATLAAPEDEQVAAAVGFTVVGEQAQLLAMEELTGRPPFTEQSTFASDRTRLAAEIARATRAASSPEALRAARGLIQEAVRRDPRNPSLRFQAVQVALHLDDARAAEEQVRELKSLLPPSPELAGVEAFVAHRLDRTGEAVRILRATADAFPYYYQTYPLLAALWTDYGDLDGAQAWFSDRVRRWPESRVVRAAQGQVLLRAGKNKEAEEAWRAVLATAPDDERALAPLVDLLVGQDRLDEAMAVMAEAYAVNPRSYANNERLAQLAEHRGDVAAQARYLEALAESGPVDPSLFFELATLQARSGNGERARFALLAGRRLAHASGDEVLARAFASALAGEAPR